MEREERAYYGSDATHTLTRGGQVIANAPSSQEFAEVMKLASELREAASMASSDAIGLRERLFGAEPHQNGGPVSPTEKVSVPFVADLRNRLRDALHSVRTMQEQCQRIRSSLGE